MGKILVKRVYEPADKSDGFRVLIDRVWPRGISKAAAKLNLWLPDAGPSTALRKWFNYDPARWAEFCRRYHVELKKKTALLATIKKQATPQPVTLLYSAKDEQHNQAVALRSFLVKQPALLRRNPRHATEVVQRLGKRSTTLSGKETVTGVRRDRGRRGKSCGPISSKPEE